METIQDHSSWDPLSIFSDLGLSLSQDSCYASDEQSAGSVITSITTSSNMSSVQAAKIAVVRPLKSILKKPDAQCEDEDAASESGYESESSDCEFDASSDCDSTAFQDSDSDGEDIFGEEDTSHISFEEDSSEISAHSHEDGEFSFDDSHIVFESCVRFNPNVRYIDASDSEDDMPNQPEMTFHEMMEIARASGGLKILQEDTQDENDDCSEDGYNSTDSDIMDGPEEHARDDVELDKQLFVAYMNGINGVPDHFYKSRLHNRAKDIRAGHAQTPFFESETINGAYLDHVLNHVIGVFRNLVARQEFDELANLSEAKAAMEQLDTPAQEIESCTRTLLAKIELLLSDRLAEGQVEVGQDELSFFAGGVVYALENWSIYTYD